MIWRHDDVFALLSLTRMWMGARVRLSSDEASPTQLICCRAGSRLFGEACGKFISTGVVHNLSCALADLLPSAFFESFAD